MKTNHTEWKARSWIVLLVIPFLLSSLPAYGFRGDESPRSRAPAAPGQLKAPVVHDVSADQLSAAQLASQAGITTEWDPQLGTPLSIRGANLGQRAAFSGGKGLTLKGGGAYVQDAIAVLDNLSRFFRIADASQEFTVKKEDTDTLDFHHVRLAQVYQGLRVVGGDLVVHFDANGQPYQVNGQYVAGIGVETNPKIAGGEAVLTAQHDLAALGKPGGSQQAEPTLVVFARNVEPTLAYEFVLVYDDPSAGPGRWRYWVDARQGTVLFRYNDIQKIAPPTANGTNAIINGYILTGEGGQLVTVQGWYENTGYYYLWNTGHVWYVYNRATNGYPDNGTYAYRATPNWGTSDRVEMSAARNFDFVQRYYKEVHGRNSYNNGGMWAQANVHYGSSYVNAFWDGTAFWFGDGNGYTATPLDVMDVSGHEYTHAVTEYTANLIYSQESGALNESFSDIMGACVEFWAEPDGRTNYPGKAAGTADWLCGEDCWVSSTALRDMRNPRNTATVGSGNEQPSKYKGTYWDPLQEVHANSGVQNFFFYLLCEGGSGNNDGILYNVTGIGVTNAERVAFRALTVYCTPNTDYARVRSAWLSAALDLNPAWAASVGAAWSAVGINAMGIYPVTPLVFRGPAGGPFSPATQNLTLINRGAIPILWGATAGPWTTLSPATGTVPALSSNTVGISINAAANALGVGIYTNTISFTNNVDTGVQTAQVKLLVGQPDYYTELFDAADNDLAFQSWTFTPDGSASFYSLCRDPATVFPTSPLGGQLVTPALDTTRTLTITNGQHVSLYGANYTTIYLAPAGYITFTLPLATNFTESFAVHFNRPRVSALFDDLNPAAAGAVYWQQLSNRVALTWLNAREYETLNTNSFQIEMFFDGRIRLTYLRIDAKDGLVGLSRGLGVPVNFAESDFTSYNSCAAPLLVTVPASATEGDGVLAGNGHVILSSPLATNATIQLSSSDTSECTVPATVLITAGQTNVAFDLTVQDDAVLDGTQPVVITAAASGFTSGSGTILINDNESATLSVLLPATATEGDPPVQGTVSVSAAPTKNVTVSLASGDLTEILVPASVVIPAGQTSAVFNASIVDDSLIDGPQIVMVTAHVPNWTDGVGSITVLDNENVNLTVQVPTSAWENAGVLSGAGSVSISGLLPTNLVVSLNSGTPSSLQVPATATIPGGQLGATFDLTLIDNALVDSNRTVIVSAAAPGFVQGSDSILVMDDESPPMPFNPNPPDLATNVSAATLLSWSGGGGGPGPGPVLWDLTHGVYYGYEPGGEYSTLASILANNGYTLTTTSNGVLNANLNSYKVLVIALGSAWYSQYSPAEVTAIQNFVTGGGGLLVISDNPGCPNTNLNPVTAVFGISCGLADVGNNTITILTNHPALAGCTQISLAAGGALSVAPPATTIGWSALGQSVFAAYESGGRVLVVGDLNVWDNPYIGLTDNRRFATNAFAWLAQGAGGPEGVTYDVYMGGSPASMALIASNLTQTTCNPGLLAPAATYFWQVIAKKVGTTAGPVWRFTTRGVDHFAWNTITSPQFKDVAFGVTITAQDDLGRTVTNFTGPVGLSGWTGAAGGYLFHEDFEDGDISDWIVNAGSYIRAVTNDTAASGTRSLTLIGGNQTHFDGVSHTLANIAPDRLEYYARVVATNSAAGYVVVGRSTSSFAGWAYFDSDGTMNFAGISALNRPAYNANQWYKISFVYNWTNRLVSYYRDNVLIEANVPFDDVSITNLSVVYLYNFYNSRAWWDEISFGTGNLAGLVSITPTNSGSFVSGSWSGNMTVQQQAMSMYLRAEDDLGRSGNSANFAVLALNDLGLSMSAAPGSLVAGQTWTNSIVVTNTGPTAATGVFVTNVCPATATFVSAQASQGSYSLAGNIVTFNAGAIAGATAANFKVVVAPVLGGSITNLAVVTRAEADGDLSNNSATTTAQVQMPSLAINNVSAPEGNAGFTPFTFTVQLSPAAATNVTVNYATANGTAQAGSDYVAASGTLTFLPGQTSQTLTVQVIGDTNAEPDETFSVVLSSPVNATLGIGVGTGTILNDEVFPAGYLRSTIGTPWGTSANETAMNRVFGTNSWQDLRYETVSPALLFSAATKFVYMEGSDQNALEMQSFLTANMTFITNWVAAGGRLFLNAAPNEGSGMYLGFGATLVYPDTTGTGIVAVAAHPIFSGPFTPVGTNWTGTWFGHATITGTGLTTLITNSLNAHVLLAERAFGAGRVLLGGMTTDNFHSPQPQASNLRANIIAYTALYATNPPPVGLTNDLCTGATVIASLTYTNSQSTTNATSTGDPLPGCGTGFGSGVWYRFTPPLNGKLVVDTTGSDFDTILAIYTGSCGSLTPVACDDDGGGGVTSKVSVQVSVGATVYILVGGFGGDTGNLALHSEFTPSGTAPVIITQPASQTVPNGSNAVFSVQAAGSLPLAYQWYFNQAVALANGTSQILTLPGVTPADAGAYSVIVTNSFGAATSLVATLSVVTTPTEFFTEWFDSPSHTNDLAFRSFTFTPDASANFYSVCQEPAAAFPTDPTGATLVTLSDDSYVQVTLSASNTVAIFSRRTNVFFIGSNGYLTMDTGDTSLAESFTNHFNRPRISACYDDLYPPGTGGAVSWMQLPDRAVVTYNNVQEYGTTNRLNCQIEMFYDGRIRLTYLAVGIVDGLAGLSPGQGWPNGFVASDLSAYMACPPPDDLRVVPATGFVSQGSAGGPFTPASTSYNLANGGTNDLPWSAQVGQTWLSVYPSAGILAPGTATNLTLALTAQANSLAAGSYSQTLVISNLTSAYRQTRSAQLTVNPLIYVAYSATFDAGNDGFTYVPDPDATSNLWHRTSHRFASGGFAQYYGLENVWNYNTGARNAGNAQSPVISLGAAAAPITLSFKSFLQGEGGSFDVPTVLLSSDNGVTWNVLGAPATNPVPITAFFTNWSANLSAYAGKSIILRLNFDTIDAINNGYEGWYVDDIVITASPGLVILAPACSNEQFRFSFRTEVGKSYVVEYKDALVAGPWTPIQTNTGDGTIQTVTNAVPGAAHGFFRIYVP